MQQNDFAEMVFSHAAAQWLGDHSRYIKPRTIKDYQQYIKALTPFFGHLRLKEIHIGNVRQYQTVRKVMAGHSRINMELSTLQQILKEAKLWQNMAELYRPLQVSHRG